MANKRLLKKTVGAVSGSVIDEMFYALGTVEKADKEAISNAIARIVEVSEEARKNSNITFDRGVKAFGSLKEYSVEKRKFYKALFNKILTDYNKGIEEALKEFNGAIPEEIKSALKEVAK